MAYLHSSLPDSRISLYKSQDLGICYSHSYQPSQYGTNTTRSFTYPPNGISKRVGQKEFKQQEEKDKLNHPDSALPSDSLEASSSKQSFPHLPLSFIGPTAPKGARVSSASLPESIFGHLCLNQRLHSQQTRIYFSSTSVRKHRPG